MSMRGHDKVQSWSTTDMGHLLNGLDGMELARVSCRRATLFCVCQQSLLTLLRTETRLMLTPGWDDFALNWQPHVLGGEAF